MSEANTAGTSTGTNTPMPAIQLMETPAGRMVKAGANKGQLRREQMHEYQVYACNFLKTHPIAALFRSAPGGARHMAQ